MREKVFHISGNNLQNRENLRGKRVAVLGAARSGMALVRLLQRTSARILLSDVKPETEISSEVRRLKQEGIEVEFGGHSQKILTSELICISPGIPPAIPILKEAHRRQIPVVGELEVASWFCVAPVIAITGSNGKTTTTTLAGEIFKKQFKNLIIAGNIGTPFASQVQNVEQPRLVILEVSSFQLETIVNFHPRITVIMNLSPNHLDRYPDFEAYAQAKLRILQNMTPEDILIYNVDDPVLPERLGDVPVRKIPFSNFRFLKQGAFWNSEGITIRWNGYRKVIPVTESHLRGPHNRYNMIVAALLAVLHDIPESRIQHILQTFPGIVHRLEVVKTINGVTFVNDSKATTVESLLYALQSFEEPLILIAGGKDKGGDFSIVNSWLSQRVRAAVLIGQARGRMRLAWRKILPLTEAETLEEAVHTAYKIARAGDVVLFSPACSSFDMFRDYEARGERFKAIVHELNPHVSTGVRTVFSS